MSDRDLEAEVDELRAQLLALKSKMDSFERHPGISMRRHHRCPACAGTSLLHLAEVRDQTFGEVMSILSKGTFKKRSLGAFEVFVCRRCERVEWYAKGAADIEPETLGRAYRKHVTIVDGEAPDEGPFR